MANADLFTLLSSIRTLKEFTASDLASKTGLELATVHIFLMRNIDLFNMTVHHQLDPRAPRSGPRRVYRLRTSHHELIDDKLTVIYNEASDSTSPKFYSCFVSYSHKDTNVVEKLCGHLHSLCINFWRDKHKMFPGDDIYEKVDYGIRLFDKFLLCCSESSLTSWWVDNEIDLAFEKERHLMRENRKKALVLIPINIDGYMFSTLWKSGKAGQIKSRIAADFTAWDKDGVKFAKELDRLVCALRIN